MKKLHELTHEEEVRVMEICNELQKILGFSTDSFMKAYFVLSRNELEAED